MNQVAWRFIWPLLFLTPLLCKATESAPTTKPSDQQLESWWADLAKPEPDSSRALLMFADHPAETVAFLKEKLQPLTISSDQVKALLAKLGSDDETIWKPAFEQLEYFDPRLAIDLETLMKEVTETPVRQRLVEILSNRPAESLEDKTIRLRKSGSDSSGYFNFVAEPDPNDKNSTSVSWWAEPKISRLNSSAFENAKPKRTRAVRAIILLEHIATPEAVNILNTMAGGNPDAQPTKAAKEAVARLATTAH